MRVLVLLGAPGAGKGTQAHILARHLGPSPGGHRRPLPGRGPRRDAPRASRPRATWTAARSSPTRSPSACSSSASRPPDAARGRHPRRLPADALPGRGARRRARRARARRSTPPCYVDVPGGRAPGAPLRALALRGGRPPLPRDRLPAARRRRLRHRRLAPHPARRRPAGDRPGAPREAARRPGGRGRPLPRRRASSRRSTGDGPIAAVTNDLLDCIEPVPYWRTPPVITRKSTAEIASDAPRRARRGRGPGPRRGGAPARRLDGAPRRAGRDAHPRGRARRRRSRATTATRRLALHLDRRRGRPRHPGRPGDPRRPGRLDRRRRDRRRLARRRRPHLRRRATRPPAVRDLVEATRLALEAGIAAARAGQPDLGHLGGRRGRRPAPRLRRSSGRTSATASAPPMHEEPQVPNYRTRTRGIELAPGHLPGDRADVHAGLGRRRDARRTAGPWCTRDGSLAAHWEDSIAVTDERAGGPDPAVSGAAGACRIAWKLIRYAFVRPASAGA